MELGAEIPNLTETAVKVDEESYVKGYISGNEMWIEQASAIDLLLFYFHEVGHTLGAQLSFDNAEVLIPDEAAVAKIKMGKSAIAKMQKLLVGEKVLKKKKDINDVIKFGNKILKTFSRESFDPKSIILHTNLSHKQLISVIKKRGIPLTMRFTPQGIVEQIISSTGRNKEMPSYATEIGCGKILENTIRQVDPTYGLEILPPPTSSHLRAYKIVQRAYQRKNWVLPSTRDLR